MDNYVFDLHITRNIDHVIQKYTLVIRDVESGGQLCRDLLASRSMDDLFSDLRYIVHRSNKMIGAHTSDEYLICKYDWFSITFVDNFSTIIVTFYIYDIEEDIVLNIDAKFAWESYRKTIVAMAKDVEVECILPIECPF